MCQHEFDAGDNNDNDGDDTDNDKDDDDGGGDDEDDAGDDEDEEFTKKPRNLLPGLGGVEVSK